MEEAKATVESLIPNDVPAIRYGGLVSGLLTVQTKVMQLIEAVLVDSLPESPVSEWQKGRMEATFKEIIPCITATYTGQEAIDLLGRTIVESLIQPKKLGETSYPKNTIITPSSDAELVLRYGTVLRGLWAFKTAIEGVIQKLSSTRVEAAELVPEEVINNMADLVKAGLSAATTTSDAAQSFADGISFIKAIALTSKQAAVRKVLGELN